MTARVPLAPPPPPPPPAPYSIKRVTCDVSAIEKSSESKYPPPPPKPTSTSDININNNNDSKECDDVNSVGEEDGSILSGKGNPVETPPTSGNFPRNLYAKMSVGVGSLPKGFQQRVSRFQFVSDTKAVSELSLLEEETFRRRNEFRERSNDLYRRLALISTKLSQEQMDRQTEQSHLLDMCVYEPLERASERFLRRMTQTKLMEETVHTLEQKLSHIDSNLLHHVHVKSHHSRFAQLESLRSSIRHQVQPLLQLESTKADKREGGLVRKLESMAGMSARSFAGESAQRYSSIKLLEQRVQQQNQRTTQRQEQFLDQIRQLRIQLQNERKKRVKADEDIIRKIIVNRQHFQRIALESLGES